MLVLATLLVTLLMCNRPSDIGLAPYGATDIVPHVRPSGGLGELLGVAGRFQGGLGRVEHCIVFSLPGCQGSVFIGGAVVQWLRDGLQVIRNASEVEALAASVPDNGGVYLVPAFAGLGAPHWDAYARGAMFGLTRGATRAHIARAALEAIAFQNTDVLKAMERDAGLALTELRVDGGAAANNLLMQFQADLLGIPVVRPQVTETTALGAAYLAGLACGVYAGTDELAAQWQEERRFTPTLPRAAAQERMAEWQKAVAKATAS